MRTAALRLLVALLALAGGRPAPASTYYVDPAGSDGAPGSAAAPWQTIRHAAATIVGGDTVIVRPGVYRESVLLSVSGTAEAPITYWAPDGAALESPNPAASLSAFDVREGVGHVIVDGFEARGGFHETFFLRPDSHDVTIRNCQVHGNRLGIWVASAVNVDIDGCQVHHNSARGIRISGSSRNVTVRNTASSDNDDGLGCFGDADGFVAEKSAAGITFVECVAERNGQDGFDLQADGVLLARSESRDNGCSGVKLGQNGRLENAIVTGNQTGVATTSLNNAPVAVEIFNSTVAGNSGTQLFFKQPNTNGAPPVSYRVLVRNVVASGPGKAIEAASAVRLTEDHNLFFRDDTTSGLLVRHLSPSGERRYSGQEINAGIWATESGQGSGTWAIAPGFLAAADYRVAADSAAADGGSASGAPAEDRDGVARPQGGAVDIGPHEAPGAVTNHRPWADPGPNRAGVAGARIKFSGYGSADPDGDALAYAWDFGDGSAGATGYAAAHTYAAAGDYTVTLTVSDGRLSHSRSVQVSVAAAAVPTPTPAAPTPTPGGESLHDSVIRPGRPVKVQLRKGITSLLKRVTVTVLNADRLPVRERPGHEIQLVAEEGTCPLGTLAGGPDFSSLEPGDQDRVMVSGGGRKKAVASVFIHRDAFTSPGPTAPAGCRLHFTAIGPGTDPTPDDNAREVELQVFDANDY